MNVFAVAVSCTDCVNHGPMSRQQRATIAKIVVVVVVVVAEDGRTDGRANTLTLIDR